MLILVIIIQITTALWISNELMWESVVFCFIQSFVTYTSDVEQSKTLAFIHMYDHFTSYVHCAHTQFSIMVFSTFSSILVLTLYGLLETLCTDHEFFFHDNINLYITFTLHMILFDSNDFNKCPRISSKKLHCTQYMIVSWILVFNQNFW